jgi:uncharacterized protein (TIGR02271 family)
MMEQTLTALYDTQGAAAAVRNELARLGIPDRQVTIQGSSGAGTAGSAPDEDRGFWDSLKDAFMPEEDRHTYAEGIRRGSYLLTARVPENLMEQAHVVLEQGDPVDVDERATTWRQDGWSGVDGTTRTTTTTVGAAETGSLAVPGRSRTAGSDGEILQVAEEELRVGKREVGRGAVRVHSYVTERHVEEQVTLRDETVRVERRPVDREVKAGNAVFEERTIEVTERGEEAVVSKTARVVEEISLGKNVETRTETVRDTVRKQDVEVIDERTGRGLAATGAEVETGADAVLETTDRPAR